MTTFNPREYDTAHNFLTALRLTNPEWFPFSGGKEPDRAWQRDWIFRGQGNTAWSLLPTALRNDHYVNSVMKHLTRYSGIEQRIDVALSQEWEKQKKDPHTEKEEWQRTKHVIKQAVVEYTLVNDFIVLSDTLGHHTPSFETSPPTRERFIKGYIENLYRYGNQFYWEHPAVALAQHHRIPTRLLDWTRQPLVAAYFAAADMVNATQKDTSNDEKLVVFAIHLSTLKDHIKLVTVPRSENPYLRAQEGIFTYDDKTDNFYIQHGKYLSIEESLEQTGREPSEYVMPQKLILPALEAPELLRLLWLEHITVAHLMPTLDNVSEALKLQWRLNDKIGRS